MYLFFILVQHSFTVFNTHMLLFIRLFIHLFPGLNYIRIPFSDFGPHCIMKLKSLK